MYPIVQTLTNKRAELKLSLRAVAKRIGVSHTAVLNWENGWSDPTLVHLQAWARAVNCRIEIEVITDEHHNDSDSTSV